MGPLEKSMISGMLETIPERALRIMSRRFPRIIFRGFFGEILKTILDAIFGSIYGRSLRAHIGEAVNARLC